MVARAGSIAGGGNHRLTPSGRVTSHPEFGKNDPGRAAVFVNRVKDSADD